MCRKSRRWIKVLWSCRGFKIQGFQWTDLPCFTLVYPLELGNFSGERPRALQMPRRTPPRFLSGLCSLAIRGHRPDEGGHSECCSHFEEFSPARASGAVPSSSIWPCMMFSVSVKFNKFNGYWDFQISMDVLCLVPIFKVPLICQSRNFGRVSVTINVARFCWSR